MAMAAAQPAALGPVVLNDIGPVIEHTGLSRIAAYVGRIPLPGTWAEAADMVRDLFKRSFPGVVDEEWEDIARQLLNERNGKPAPGYDPQIAAALSVLDGPLPELWPQFEVLKRVPVLVLRGEVTDLLSVETVEEMRRRHPAFMSYTVQARDMRRCCAMEQVSRPCAAFFDEADARLAGDGLTRPSVMIQKFAASSCERHREFLDLNHTSNTSILVSLMIPKFALDASGQRWRTSESGHYDMECRIRRCGTSTRSSTRKAKGSAKIAALPLEMPHHNAMLGRVALPAA